MNNINQQSIDGLCLLDKPIGLSSNQALQQVKKLFRAKKAGHTGSLDPLATGVLPICFGQATKFSQFLLDSDKTYQVKALFGISTDTGDAQGQVIARQAGQLDPVQLAAVLTRFIGPQQQTPPMYSALKQGGKPLYQLARAGITVERVARSIRIDQLQLLGCQDNFCDLLVRCSKGTYIRSLVEDLGQALGLGAHVVELRRTHSAGFALAQCYTLAQLNAVSETDPSALMSCLQPTAVTCAMWPAIECSSDQVLSLRFGQRVIVEAAGQNSSAEPHWVRILDLKQQFIGMGQLDDQGQLRPKRLLA